jgi:hypothetical protein
MNTHAYEVLQGTLVHTFNGVRTRSPMGTIVTLPEDEGDFLASPEGGATVCRAEDADKVKADRVYRAQVAAAEAAKHVRRHAAEDM